MANTTNFGWETPDDTDLVKDGAAAMRTLGNAIDTSFVDLKGGTTGQILSKASNTDLDYSWVSPNPGDITSVAAGTGLTGGGTSGDVTVSIDPTYYLLANQTRRNPILNSNFSVWQRGTSIAYASGLQYTTDRYILYRGGSTATTISRQATGDTTNLPNIQYCARVQRNAGDTTTNAIYLSYSQETINSVPLAGKTITFSYYARKGANFSEAGSNLSLVFNTGTGTDQCINNGYTGSVSAISTAVTLTTTWQRFTHTATLPSTATELGFYFYYTPSGTAGANDYFEITGIQLELGSTANTYMPNQPTYQGELAACQRYYYRWTTGGTSTAWINNVFNYSSTVALGTVKLPVTMRVNPTSIDVTATASDYRLLTGSTVSTCSAVPVLDTSNFETPVIKYTVASGLTVGQGGIAGANSTNSAYIGFNAEL